MKTSRTVVRVGLLLGTCAVALLSAEVGLRIMDGQPLAALALRRTRAESPAPHTSAPRPDLRHVERVALAPAVDRQWYESVPVRRPPIPLDDELITRAARYSDETMAAFFEFNRHYLQQQICAGRRDLLGSLQDFFYFEPTDRQPYPTYRHLRHVSPPSWFVTNNFGWRGSDVTLNRPAETIRIAFVGASTTVDNYGSPFSHPELIGHWLGLWAERRALPYRVEVINAGRTGIDSRSVEAIVRKELVPIDPDLVVFYEGANQFWPGQLVTYRFGRLFRRPSATFDRPSWLARHSALASRTVSAVDRMLSSGGWEPRKPPARVDWPAGVDEASPNPTDRRLPMDLPQVIADLDRMRAALASRGGEIVMSSFIWLVDEGLQLDPARHANIYRFLNDTYWPIRYADMRRMADFQNRVFARYARSRGLSFVDIAREFPRDPDLFDDAIHLQYPGLRLQGWIYLQHLVRLIEERLAAGRLPRPPAPRLDVHPEFTRPDRRLMTAAELAAQCS